MNESKVNAGESRKSGKENMELEEKSQGNSVKECSPSKTMDKSVEVSESSFRKDVGTQTPEGTGDIAEAEEQQEEESPHPNPPFWRTREQRQVVLTQLTNLLRNMNHSAN